MKKLMSDTTKHVSPNVHALYEQAVRPRLRRLTAYASVGLSADSIMSDRQPQ